MLKPEEDLFEDTKMSFGEHLEELRSALIKAFLALALGVLVGFIPPIGDGVIRFIQEPLQQGLEDFHAEKSAADFETYLDKLRDEGQELPEDLEAAAKIYAEQGLAPRVLRVDPKELAKLLRSRGFQVETPPNDQLNPEADQDAAVSLLPLVVWTPQGDSARTQTIGTGITDAFMVWVKAALLVGVVLSSPFVFYFLWSFVASGLYPHERKYVNIFLPFSIGLFLAGAAVAFFLAMGYVLDTMFWFYQWLEIDPTPRISEWLSFALLLPIGFGLGFQLPLVMLFLERIGIFRVEDYTANWRYGVLAIAIASMLLTPSDWQSMVLLAIPMTGLYFGGIALCRLWPRQASPLDGAMEGPLT